MVTRTLLAGIIGFASALALQSAALSQDSGAETSDTDHQFDLDIYGATSAASDGDQLVYDPFEGFNRRMYAFNDGLDRRFITPVIRGYRFVVPRFGRNRIRDFIDNLKTPVWFVNETLQGDFGGAGTQAARFGLNTTIGLAGFYDFADAQVGLTKHDEDFGQTLAVYSVDNGPYLVLPFLGPSTARDLTGTAVDTVFDPFTWSQFPGDTALRLSTTGADIVDIRERADGAVEIIRGGIDPYVEARTLYIQSRNARLAEAWREDAGEQSIDNELDRYDDF